MANFDNIKGAVLDTLGTVAGKTRDFAGTVADKAKDISRIAKLNIEIGSEKETIKKAYIEMGKLYYQTHRDDPEDFFVQLCDEVTASMESITAKEAEIAEIKARGNISDDDIVVEFEEVVAQSEAAADNNAQAQEESANETSEAQGEPEKQEPETPAE